MDLRSPDTWVAVVKALGDHPYEYDFEDESERLDAVQIICETLASVQEFVEFEAAPRDGSPAAGRVGNHGEPDSGKGGSLPRPESKTVDPPQGAHPDGEE
jgi:hypothetical protein